ncbi:MAG: sugar phosphate isomerase/epimerase, partial [Verrucomicrobiota bacterium]|nr:sugar phosphate isomerase/epimerase [Verrucomicrobiota bacterium]
PSPDSFDSLDKLVAKYDIRIAIHNHGPGALYDKIDDGLKAVKGHDKRIGFCADLGHYIRSSEDPVEVIHKLGDRLYGIHLKDFAEQKKRTHGVIIGKGHLDVSGVFKALKKVKFPADGALSLEYEETPNDHPKLLGDIRECLAIAAEGAQKAAKG